MDDKHKLSKEDIKKVSGGEVFVFDESCPKCHINLVMNHGRLVCPKCGWKKDI